MLKFNIYIYCDYRQCKIHRLFFLLLLVLFAISPIADAYADSYCSSRGDFNDLNDSDDTVVINNLKLNGVRKPLHAFKHASKLPHDDHTLFLRTSPQDGPVGRITKREIPFFAIKSSQICPPFSSDPSPPPV